MILNNYYYNEFDWWFIDLLSAGIFTDLEFGY